MNLEKIFSEFLERENLVGEKLLLLISGGTDSRVLFDIAKKVVKIENIGVLSIHHQTGESADDAFQFVQNLCTKERVIFFGEMLREVPEKNKEDFWRQQRKAFAQQAAEKFGAARILTAHHATDLTETMLFRMTKGTGPSGLSPFDISTKPFWQMPKSEVEKYATTHKLEFIEDPTNRDLSFERNLIRHQVIPELRKITPNLEQVFVREAKLFGEVQELIDSLLNDKVDQNKFPLSDFLKLHPVLKKEFLRKIAEKTPSSSEVEDCLRWLEGSPPGNSEKQIGGTKLSLIEGSIRW